MATQLKPKSEIIITKNKAEIDNWRNLYFQWWWPSLIDGWEKKGGGGVRYTLERKSAQGPSQKKLA